jgi:hypothetical protein
MNRLILIVVSVFAFLILQTAACAYQNEPTGFGGIPWGTHVSKVKNLKYVGKECDAPQCDTLYTKTDDKLTFGGENVKEIQYLFNKNVFVGVVINDNGSTKWRTIRDYLKKQYGDANGLAVTNNPIWERFEWKGSTTNIWSCLVHMNDSINIVMFSAKHSSHK